MTTVVLLFGLGMLLVTAEVFIPSLGILGMLAALSLIGSIVAAFAEGTGTGMTVLLLTAVLVPIVMTFGIKLFPKTPIGRKITARGFSFEDGRGVDRRDEDLPGEVGVVEAMLRPAGIARIGGRRVDVVSRGETIDKGETVTVVEVSGNRVVVARAPVSPNQTSTRAGAPGNQDPLS